VPAIAAVLAPIPDVLARVTPVFDAVAAVVVSSLRSSSRAV